MNMIQVGKFIATLRKEHDFTQEQLGEELGVTNKTISRWETGVYLPPVDTLLKMSEIFGVSINEMLSGKRLTDSEYRKALAREIAELYHVDYDGVNNPSFKKTLASADEKVLAKKFIYYCKEGVK